MGGTARLESRSAGDRIIVVCRSPGPKALLERLLGSAEIHPSAVEAVLSATRRSPRAVVLNLEDVAGAEYDLLAALRRAKPDVPVYAVVKPENEPIGRSLVREGAADYFVLPGDVSRLPRVLADRPVVQST